ncbi:MAG: hypothetical protein NC311_09170 [Muribaculaceae bacterium]|nr:hypothetical protein [Muribaculaceae bacterium]
MPAGTPGTSGSTTSTSPNWFKKNWLGLSAGVIATIALIVGMNNCSGNSDRDARIDDVAANVDSLTVNQTKIIEVVQNHETRIQNNATAINNLKSRMDNAESDISDLQDSIAVHRTEIDSLKMGVDSIAKLQQKCPCINPKAVKKSGKRPARPNNVPVRRDTIAGQVASGCGSNQNAAVVIGNNSSNNTVIINNGAGNVEATKAKPDTITQSWTAKGQVTVVVARRGYCR